MHSKRKRTTLQPILKRSTTSSSSPTPDHTRNLQQTTITSLPKKQSNNISRSAKARVQPVTGRSTTINTQQQYLNHRQLRHKTNRNTQLNLRYPKPHQKLSPNQQQYLSHALQKNQKNQSQQTLQTPRKRLRIMQSMQNRYQPLRPNIPNLPKKTNITQHRPQLAPVPS